MKFYKENLKLQFANPFESLSQGIYEVEKSLKSPTCRPSLNGRMVGTNVTLETNFTVTLTQTTNRKMNEENHEWTSASYQH